MILPPGKREKNAATPYALETLRRLPLAEAFYTAWAYIAPDDVLDALFDEYRGRCYEDTLSFAEVVFVLADAVTRHHGSGNRAITKAIERQQLPVKVRAVYGKLSRLPLPLAEALLCGLTARLRCLFPVGLFRNDIPQSLKGLNLVVLDGKKIKRAAKRLLATRGLPGTLFGGKVLVAYSPADGLAVAMAADPDGEANDIRLMPRVMPLARQAVPGARLWIADRQFCDLDQPERFTEQGDHFLVRFNLRVSFEPDGQRPAVRGFNAKGQVVVQEWGWMGAAEDPRRRYVRRVTLERPGEEAVILVTDLLDEAAYPADDLLLAYLIRWQIENVFQEITEVFELRQLIGSTPRATVFQASLCLVIYNVLQLLRGHAALAAPDSAPSEPKPAGEAKAAAEPKPADEAKPAEAKPAEAKPAEAKPAEAKPAEAKPAEAKPAEAKAAASAAKVEELSSEKIFADLHEELTGLHRVLKVEEMLPCLPAPLTAQQARQRLGQLMRRAWSALWRKAKNKKPRPAKPQAKQLGAHTSVHKALLQAREPQATP
jgi:DDE family transposase